MDLIWGLLIFFIFITMAFLVIALMFPEWVGITGKKALEIQKHQSGEATKTTIGESNESSSNASAASPSKENSHQ